MKNSMRRAALTVRLAFAERAATKLRLAGWVSALALAVGAQQMSAATITYIVGTCTSGTQFKTIQAALDASPAPDTVEVCPGQYAEQVTITKPVTLEGIPGSQNPLTFGGEGIGSLAQIILPDDYTANVTLTDAFGDSFPTAVAQVYVKNVIGGAVNLTNLDVNGMNQSAVGSYFVGVVYQGSSGTINHVITSSQNGTSSIGFGMWIEGGSSKPSVTVEDCSMHDFTASAIFATGTTLAPNLTVTIENNDVASNAGANSDVYNLVAEAGTNAMLSENVVNGGITGIYIDTPTGSITGNTVVGSGTGIAIASPDDSGEEGTGLAVSGNTISGSQIGIQLVADGPSVTSNRIFNSVTDGIVVYFSVEKSVVENNVIRTVNAPGSIDSTGTGIELKCNKTSSSLVHSNTIVDANLGYGDAPAGFTGSNTYIGVVTDVGNCINDAVSSKPSAAPPLKPLALWQRQ